MKKDRFLLIFFNLFMIFLSTELQAGTSQGFALVLDSNGRVIVVGSTANTTNGSLDMALARYNPDGSLDTSFNATGIQPGTVTFGTGARDEVATAVALDANGKIVVVGASSRGLLSQWEIVRFNDDGSLDTTFNPDGIGSGQAGVVLLQIGAFDGATDVAIDSQNRIVVSGTTNNGTITRAAVARFTPEGALDDSFGSESLIPGLFLLTLNNDTTRAAALALTPLNEVYVVGSDETTTITQFLTFKLTSQGTLDPTFTGFNSPEGTALLSIQGIDDVAFDVALDAEGRIVVGGYSTQEAGFTEFALVRYLPTGLLDLSFNELESPGRVLTQFSTNSAAIRSVALDSAQNIVVTGFSNTGTNDAFTTARYTPNGLLDSSFGQGGVVITDVPITQQSFASPSSSGTGIVVGDQDTLYLSGYSFDGFQNNFTTISYLSSGALNPGFNPFIPGIVITVFGVAIPLGNGVPLTLETDLSAVSPDIIENVLYPVTPIEPVISTEGPLITNDIQPFIQGIASANSLVTVYLNEVPLLTVLADYKGNWEALLPPLLDGEYSLTVSAVNPITGLSLSSLPFSLTIATNLPDPPSIQTPVHDQRFTQDTVLIKGKAVASHEVTILIDGEIAGTVVASKAGNWSFSVGPLTEGVHSIAAGVTDRAGNRSPLSKEKRFRIDTIPRAIPRILTPQNAEIIQNSTVQVTGEAPAHSTVRLYLNGEEYKTVKADKERKWSLVIQSLPVGEHQIHATSFDRARSSETVTITINPSTSPQQRPPLALVNGFIQGTADPGTQITLFLNGERLGQVVANAQGAWAYGPVNRSNFQAGRYTLSLTIAPQGGGITSVIKREITL